MDIYREHILDHYRNPHNRGLQATATLQEVGYNPLCGDVVTVQLDIKGDQVMAMRYESHGCAISIAAASLVSEAIKNKAVTEIMKTGLPEVETLLGTSLHAGRVNCGLLALQTVHQGLRTKLLKEIS